MAETSFLKATDIARSCRKRGMLELRAATDLARLWREAGACPTIPCSVAEPDPRWRCPRAERPQGMCGTPSALLAEIG